MFFCFFFIFWCYIGQNKRIALLDCHVPVSQLLKGVVLANMSGSPSSGTARKRRYRSCRSCRSYWSFPSYGELWELQCKWKLCALGFMPIPLWQGLQESVKNWKIDNSWHKENVMLCLRQSVDPCCVVHRVSFCTVLKFQRLQELLDL